MFDVSWGELLVLVGVGTALVGRGDVPLAARFVGRQVGRIVGVLQGARARADRYAQQSELRDLQKQVRDGISELQTVRAELAVALQAPTQNNFNRTITGSSLPRPPATTTPSSNAAASAASTLSTPPVQSTLSTSLRKSTLTPQTASPALDAAMAEISEMGPATATPFLAPQEQTLAAVAEEEWKRQGLAYVSRSQKYQEQLYGDAAGGQSGGAPSTTGSVLLARLFQESLIVDQYDRVMQEQQSSLDKKMDQIEQKVAAKNQEQMPKREGKRD